MKISKYFYINNIKYNYDLEFQTNKTDHLWKQNAPLIEYCETLGIVIPHYCYHKNLSISGNCRMCLVELKNSPKPMVSCAMSAKSCLNNSKIFTNSPLVKKSRENILEFLLLNHPLDCPVCDQGGECDLQEQSFFFGMSKKKFYNFKRVVMDKNLGLIVKTVMTRCIHCTRCVRFAREIAGVEDLGIFGRGLNSEIGTYVEKSFQSELSGNVIELCPVGALTSKLYPFVTRSWELKSEKSIDYSDGFGTELTVYLKNNKIIKISPGFNPKLNSTTWISDKTRFSFDGMFSPERLLHGFLIDGKNNFKRLISWNKLLKEIVNTLYFQDHLNKHLLKLNYLVLIFGSNVSLEVLNLLIIFSKKYSFIKLRKINNNLKSFDLEHNMILNSSDKLNNSNLCFLIGLNTRYEGSYFNTKLRQRYLKGNFKIISVSSFLNLTIPLTYSGLNMKKIKQLSEGNDFLCQELANSKNPIFILSSELYKRKDSNSIHNIFKFLTSKFTRNLFQDFNLLNNSLNETGANYLQNFKLLVNTDLIKTNGIYFINSQINQSEVINKLLNLKILNYFTTKSNTNPFFCFDQNNSFITEIPKQFLKTQSCYNYINLPNNIFLESNETFLTTDGYFKKSIKVLPSSKHSKEDWQIIRKIFSYSKNINYLSNQKDNISLTFNNKTYIKYKKFINFLYFANIFFFTNNKYIFNYRLSKTIKNFGNKIKTSKTKFNLTNLKLWLKNFYVGGSDYFSGKSINMLNCSNQYKSQKTNFNL